MAINSQGPYTILKKLSNYLALLLSSVILIRWWYYIDKYSVNILYWDQWDYYTPIFENDHLWGLFFWQHAWHRQGIGFILSKILADLSGWNIRYESFAIGTMMCLATLCALILKTKLFRDISWSDVAIPLIFLTPLQYELFLTINNLSIGAVPVLLSILYCLAWLLRYDLLRYSLVILLNFLLIYAGFGLFVGIITPILFLIEYITIFKIGSKRDHIVLIGCMIISIVSIGSFFIGYEFDQCLPDFIVHIYQYWKYPLFIAVTFANFAGVNHFPLFMKAVIGFILLFMAIVIWLFHLKYLLSTPEKSSFRHSNKINVSRTIIILISFTLIFCFYASIGRVFFGVEAASASRYVTFLIPGFYGIYLHLANLPQTKMKNNLLFMTVLLLILSSFPLSIYDYSRILSINKGSSDWIKYYLQTEDIDKTNQITGWKIYPDENRTSLKWKLDYLKAKKLNFYHDKVK